MIASIRGEVLEIGLDHAVLEAAGVGYRLNATPATLATLTRGEESRLYTTMIVREDSQTLFGFADTEARDLFGLLQTVSGVGPKLAMAVLAVLEPEALRKALAESNVAALTRVPGVGKRGAERMCVELRDKVNLVPVQSGPPGSGPAPMVTPIRDQVVDALIGLGFQARQAEGAVDVVLVNDPDANTSQALRAALALLGKNR
ncbi:Holliday junction branch migration protein RuvA [Nocardia sp. 2]|uniref:Holliday junction branch migration complex subunit RuvA n=1 Tax=Nocardia acididurans TaxID=2802282 RepID=A0ABS1M945_9NOCA|nr:Holliday junction branch migration protein RuvA [Nocardia acididurans]MBL1076744.1 Holliday junction branch migration protein RuvA [Nocardia acididurans]